MHRTRTAAALLIAMTASAVSGCVSVGGPAVPQPHSRSDGAEPQPAPQARGGSGPRLVTAPAQEALRMMDPAAPQSIDSLHAPEQPKHDHSPANPASGSGQGSGPVPSEQPGQHRLADGTNRSGLTGAGTSPLPGTLVPPKSLLPGGDPCGLGEQYGQWDPGSPQDRICRAEYGS
ncbi:hypothetical protein QIS99_18105 [Streptomyces sp. B-S-A8]|uniref:Lipoprotein n=1 Tax=Streptomyces solicavernae TaxID=3043614 RepID=A0ABT6RUI2_9ACTN|nr:hypothetical protein [Streptomyces sp. B-S-A8]MDI3388099.1 hypothetical protein [Streptomyces sp. B-S-A8]